MSEETPEIHSHRDRGIVDGKKIRCFTLTNGDIIICSVMQFDAPQWQINWGQSATNDTNDGGIYMITCEWPAVVDLTNNTFKHYMEGYHQDQKSFLIKEEHIMHIMNPPLKLALHYLDWMYTVW